MVNPCSVIKLNPITKTLETPTLLLKTKWLNTIGEIKNFTNWRFLFVAQGIDEISFDVYKELDGVKCDIWDKIVDLAIVDLVGYGLFEISVSYDESNEEIKSVVGQSLEVELGQLALHDFHVNDEEAMTLDENYEPTVFYSPYDIEHSLLYRVLKNKAPHWKIGHVPTYIAINKTDQPELSSDFQRTYTVDGTTIYDFLMGDVATESNVTFIFDTYTRTINCYNLEDYTWSDGTHTITINAIGEDTDIFVNRENLANQITITGDKDSVKNCFRVSGGDDIITSRVRTVSMTGTNYITAFSPQQKADMPTELVTLLDSYAELLEKDAPQHESIYSSLYKAYDDYHYYNSKMMPNVGLKQTTAEEQAKRLVFDAVGVYSLENYNDNLFVGVTNNVEAMAQVMVDSRYDVEVVTETNLQSPTYNSNTHKWTGKFKITRATDESDTFTTDNITVTINQDEETYTRQKIEKALNRSDMLEVDLEAIDMYVEGDDVGNKTRLTNYFYGEKDTNGNVVQVGYALSRLQSFSDGYNTCLSTITDVTNSKESDVANTLYKKYHTILTVVDEVLKIRKDEVTFYEKEIKKWEATLSEFQKAHDLRTYLGESLYAIYCMYRREDEYQNSNYISDGYEDDDAKLTAIAKELLDVANAELKKACVLQRQMSTDLNNLLIMPEFSIFHNKFALYNYIRIRSNDELFKLRLLGIEYDSNSPEKINVTFAENIESIDGIISDLQSMKNAITSISSSFSSVALQAKSGSVAYNEVAAFRNEGLNAALTRVTNSINNEVTMGGFGILCKYMTDEGVYSPIQTKIIGSGLYITNDNWKSVVACIGETTDNNFGVLAPAICGQLLAGDKLLISNSSGSVTIDGDGINITNGTIEWKKNVNAPEIEDINNLSSELAQKTTDLNLYKAEISEFQKDVDNQFSTITDTVLATTVIGEDYIISPKIGGGYLYVSNGTYSVEIDPNHGAGNSTLNGYLFCIRKKSDNSRIMSVDTSGNGYFNGHIVAKSLNLDGCTISSSDVDDLDSTIKGYGYQTEGQTRMIITSYGYQTSDNVQTLVTAYGYQNEEEVRSIVTSYGYTTNSSAYDYLLKGKYFLVSGTKISEITGYNEFANTLVLKSSISSEAKKETITLPNGEKVTRTTYTTTVPNSNGTSQVFKTYDDGAYVFTNIGIGSGSSDPENSSSTDTYVMIDKNGCLTADNAVIRGSIYAIDGYFSGELKSVTGNIGSWKINENSISKTDTSGSYMELNSNSRQLITYNETNKEKTIFGNGRIKFSMIEDTNDVGYLDMYIANLGSDTNKGMNFYSSVNAKYIAFGNSEITDSEGSYVPTLVLNYGANPSNYTEDVIIYGDTKMVGNLTVTGTFNATVQNSQYSAYAHALQTYASDGTSHGNAWLLNCMHDGEKYFQLYCGDRTYGVKVDYATNATNATVATELSTLNYDAKIKNYYGGVVLHYNADKNKNVFRPVGDAIDTTQLGTTTYYWGAIYAKEGSINLSDRRVKENISTFDEKYENLFNLLNPVSYKFTNGTSGRTHLGFISQDVEYAMNQVGLSDLDFAGFCKDVKVTEKTDEDGNIIEEIVYDENNNPEYTYALRYAEFIALNTHMIQKLQKENEELKKEIKEIKEAITSM